MNTEEAAPPQRIGLRSTGLVNFSGRIVSAFTGLLFTVMVARWLVPSQLGLWEVIMDIVTFASYPIAIIAYWATRDVARGRYLGKTALGAAGLLSVLGAALYLSFSAATLTSLPSSLVPFLIGALLVPLSYWSVTANALVTGHRPGVFGISLVLSEVVKIAVAYETLYVLKLGIQGVLVSLAFAYLIQSLASTYFVRGAAVEGFAFGEVRRWGRRATIPLMSQLPITIAAADTYLAGLRFGTAIAGYYQVAFTVASVVGYSSALAISLYPILLQGGGRRLPALAMNFSLMFSIPLAVGVSVLAQPILVVFGKGYLPGSLGLPVLGLTFVILTISGIVDQTLMGTERADQEGATFWSLAKSNLMFVALANLGFSVVYLLSLYVALSYSFSAGLSTADSVALWALVQLGSALLFLVIKGARARRYGELLPGATVVYYLVAAALMGVFVYLTYPLALPGGLDALEYGGRLIGVVLAGGAVYFGAVYTMDRKFRALARSALRL